jgi:LacI family transcriptional regulator
MYFPYLIMSKNKTILLLLEWYDYRFHSGVAQAAYKYGYNILCPRHPDITKMDNFDPLEFIGCVTLCQRDDTVENLARKKVPIIELGHIPYPRPIHRVLPDNRIIGELAADHLMEHGYKHIITINHDGRKMYKERIEALQRTLEECDGSVQMTQSKNVDECFINELKTFAINRKNQGIHKPCASFACSDLLGSDIISALLSLDYRVPNDFVVLGVDNDVLLQESLPIKMSSIDTNPEGIGYKAIELLDEVLKSNKPLNKDDITYVKPKGVICRQSTSIFNIDNKVVSDALNWIHRNFHRGIQASNIAEALEVSQQGLQKLFFEHHERTPGQEIRYQRVRAVASLLRQTNVNLLEISKSCGFTNVDTMIVNFRNEMGVTPGRYRSQFIVSNH